uniref:Uncharacterized protein n=1 Tax=Anguilla anguilla TaxID=7936 RepID=A0A0E9P6N0_ANGAN
MKWTVRSFKHPRLRTYVGYASGLKTNSCAWTQTPVGEVHSQVAKRQDNNQAEL